MNKTIKIIFWIVIGVVVIAGAYLGWKYLIAKPTNETSPFATEEGAETIKPKVLSDIRVFDYWIYKPSGEIYFIGEDAKIYKIAADGETKETGSQAIDNLSYVKSSFDGSRIFIAFGYPRTPTFSVYSLNARTWQALPINTIAAAWDPRSADRLVYLKDNGRTSQLNLLDLNTNRSQTLLVLAQKDLDLDWVRPDNIYLKQRPSGQTTSSLWSFNIKTRGLKTILKDETGLLFRWSTDGSVGIKLADNSLTLIDQDGRKLTSLNISSLPSQCVFTNSLLYCIATYGEWELNDYLKNIKQFVSNIYMIPLFNIAQTAQLQSVLIFDSLLSEPKIDAEHLELNKNRLIFINRLDQKIYGLEI